MGLRLDLPSTRLAALALAALTVSACATGEDAVEPDALTTLGAYALVHAPAGFSFFPPIAPAVASTGAFDATRLADLTVELQRTDASGAYAITVARFDRTTSPALYLKADRERYMVVLRLADYFTVRTSAYRFRVLFRGVELATADMPSQVFDFIDRRPDIVLGLQMRLEARAIDRDGDGVLDVDDRCPDKADPTNAPPSAELCNGLDDDCDGTVDEDNPGGGAACDTGLRFACAVGTTRCENGHLVCDSPLPPTDPSCNVPDGSTEGLAGRSCRGILAAGASRGDGYYFVDPDGASGPKPAVRVYCDMTTDGGGWTLVARASETNGRGGDYEFSAAFGQHSLFGFGFSGGTPSSAQYTQDLDGVLGAAAHTLEIQYLCYDARSPATTRYWATARDVQLTTLRPALSAANPDMLLSGPIDNADGQSANDGNFAFFARETRSGSLTCGNVYAGQSGLKFSCLQNGQTAMTPRSVWMLTHYAGNTYSEVTSCGAVGANVLPYYAGEVRIREHACDDGVIDRGETDVDCGGRCGGCAEGLRCSTGTDCASGVCSGGTCQPPRCDDGVMNGDEGSVDCGGSCAGACVRTTCATMLGHGVTRTSGEYWIDPDGLGPNRPFRAYCDMDTDGGGWTMVARASDTNGIADYEFRAAFGAHSLLSSSWSGGQPSDAQYTLALEQGIAPSAAQVELQYFCYDRRDRSGIFWTKATGLSRSDLLTRLSASNPDFLRSATRLVNADGVIATDGQFAFFGRETAGTASCGNTYAGQSGFKYSCGQSGQTSMNPRSVWMLTHYGSYGYTEVTSCGGYGASILPFFTGEVRVREQNCTNGVQDGGETGVDCGGACGGCDTGARCNASSDCASQICTGSVCQAPRCDDGIMNGSETSIDCGGSCGSSCPYLSCATILSSGRAHAGIDTYRVDPDGAGPNAPFDVLCDMDTDGGGWTLLARASDTNGVGGDYEFRNFFGSQSLLSRSFSGGNPNDAQYTLALERAIPPSQATIDLQYLCYDRRNRAGTQYWAKVRSLSRSDLLTRLGVTNPDFLLTNVRIDNADGVTTTTGNFGFFGRETTGTASCGNGYAGQSGLKYSCAQSGQSVMNPRSVWMLTHYGSANFTEVTSCGTRAGSVLPYFSGEVRFR